MVEFFEHTRQCGHGRAKVERRGWTGDSPRVAKPPDSEMKSVVNSYCISYFHCLNFGGESPSKPEAVAWVTGACFAVRRRVLDAVNGLDEAIFMYYEDVDLGLRINRAGWQVIYLPHAEGIHIGGESSKQALTRMLVVSEASYAYFIAKHLGQWAARALRLLRPIEMTLRTVLWSEVYFYSPTAVAQRRERVCGLTGLY